jgi:DNA-binding winged helix-turn-helix (wHTH) protein
MSNESIRSFGGFTYSVPLQDVLDAEGNSARLRPQSVEVFRYLANNSERLVTRQELIDNIWPDVAVTDDSLTKCISEIRKVLSDTDRSILTTMPRRGYQLIADETDLLSNNVTDRTLVEKPDGSASWIWFAPVLLLLGIAIYFLTTAVDRSGSETPVEPLKTQMVYLLLLLPVGPKITQ